MGQAPASRFPVQIENLNQMAVTALLADADRALALTELEDVRGSAAIVTWLVLIVAAALLLNRALQGGAW